MQPVVPATYRPVVHTLLLIVALVCFTVFTLLGFGVFTGAHADGWLGLGLASFAGLFIP